MTLDCGICGILLIMGNAGYISSTVGFELQAFGGLNALGIRNRSLE